MHPVTALTRLGGVAPSREVLRLTSRRRLAAAVRRGTVRRLARGRYALPTASEARRAAGGLSGVVGLRSAAAHHEWPMKSQPEQPEVIVPRNRKVVPERRVGVRVLWTNLAEDQVADGVTTPFRTVIDCARLLPFDEALAIADSALRHGDITKARLVELADSVKGPGAPQARRVAREATHLAANPFESALRAIGLDVPGLRLEPQVVIADKEGRGRADLVDRERRWVVEAESHSWHSKRGALRRDCRRYTKLVLLGWQVLRFAWEDVMFHPDYVRQCLEAAAAVAPRQAGCTCGARLAA
jgi:very-short-patch-repair endonuclease